MGVVLAIARAAALRILRDRIAVFFLVVLPIVVIVVVGAVVGGFNQFRVGVVTLDRGAIASRITDALDGSSALRVHHYSSVADGTTALRRSEILALVEVPAGTDAAIAAGRTVAIPVHAAQVSSQQQGAIEAVSSIVVAEGGRVQAAQFAAKRGGGTTATNLALSDRVARTQPAIRTVTRPVDIESRFLPSGFNYSAPTMLVLFVFINALGAGAAMTETRQLGMYARMSAAPVAPHQIVLAEAVVYFTIALFQSLLIIGVGSLGFGVRWGNPLAAACLVVAWCLVGTGAGMLAGTMFKTPEQASSMAPAFGIVLGMLGGCMWPLEIVGPVMRTVGHFTPHAWAVDAWTGVISRGDHLLHILRPLAILLGAAALLIGIASARLRRVLTA